MQDYCDTRLKDAAPDVGGGRAALVPGTDSWYPRLDGTTVGTLSHEDFELTLFIERSRPLRILSFEVLYYNVPI